MRMNRQSARMGVVNNCVVAATSTAAASSAFGSQTYQIRVAATAACNFKIDQAPTATASDTLLPGGRVLYVTVSPGQKISAFSPTIQTISVVEVTH